MYPSDNVFHWAYILKGNYIFEAERNVITCSGEHNNVT